jgi:hypothetical protein
MGGSPKPAVDNIREMLNINQKRNDYLGVPLPPSLLPLSGGGIVSSARGSCKSWLWPRAARFSLLFCVEMLSMI